MRRVSHRIVLSATVALPLVLAAPTSPAKEFRLDNPLNPPGPVYWCPNTPDRQIATTPEPGCEPLVGKEDEKPKIDRNGNQIEDKPVLKILDIQTEASKFAQRYRDFLDCCANDINSLEKLEDLQDDASYILKSIEARGIYNDTGHGKGKGGTAPGPGDGTGSGGFGGIPTPSHPGGDPATKPKLGTFARQFTLSAIVGTVARARYDLRNLRARLEHLAEAKARLDGLDYEQAARERQRVEEEEQAIVKEFRAKRPPESARTGMEIQDTTLPTRIGGDIEDTTLNANFGADVGYTVSPYSDLREDLRPRRGPYIEDTNIPNRIGPNTQETTLPHSFGFEIGEKENPSGSSTTPSRVGPAIGDSSSNRR